MHDNIGSYGLYFKGVLFLQWVDEQLGVIRVHVRESMENKTTLWELLSNMKYRKALYIVAGIFRIKFSTYIQSKTRLSEQFPAL